MAAARSPSGTTTSHSHPLQSAVSNARNDSREPATQKRFAAVSADAMPARARALPATRLAKIARACPNSAPENPRRSGAVPEAETFVTELQCAKESKRVESERY